LLAIAQLGTVSQSSPSSTLAETLLTRLCPNYRLPSQVWLWFAQLGLRNEADEIRVG